MVGCYVLNDMLVAPLTTFFNLLGVSGTWMKDGMSSDVCPCIFDNPGTQDTGAFYLGVIADALEKIVRNTGRAPGP